MVGLANWLKANRAALEMSQRELAQRASISRSYLCDIEHGRGSQPSVVVLEKLASALGMPNAEILRASGILPDGEIDRADEYRLLAIYRDLSVSGQISVERFARFVHAEEHRWVQTPLQEGQAQATTGDSPNGPDLFDEVESTP